MKSWKTISRKTILDHSKYLSVEEHAVELPDGTLISDWPWIITPDYVNVLAVTIDEEFICFEQVKYGVEGISLAPVGGYIEPDEDPMAAAKRELLEETGYEAPDWVSLGSYRVGANRGIAMAHLFLALDAHSVMPPDSDDLEEQELIYLTRLELETALVEGRFKVLAWATVVSLGLQCLERKETLGNG